MIPHIPNYTKAVEILEDGLLDFHVSYESEDQCEISLGNKWMSIASNMPCALGDAIFKAWEENLLTIDQQSRIRSIVEV